MSYYGQYSNEGVTPWSALVDVVTHPIDSARAFVGAPVALIGGWLGSAGEAVSGIKVDKVADLPGQQVVQTLAEMVSSSPEAASAEGPTGTTKTAPGLPLWVKVTIGASAVIAAVIIVSRSLRA